MDTVRIGVIGLQGDVEEHIEAFESSFQELGVKGEAIWARRAEDLEDVSGLAIPGGESTTISKLLDRFGLRDRILEIAEEGRPILGTCAGCVLLASEGDELVRQTGTRLLALMEMAVDRNVYGSQRESFEVPIEIEGLGTYPGIFIRAPMIKRVWGSCSGIGYHDDTIVLARQGNLLAASFHPELTGDPRFYRMFLNMF